MLCTTILLNPLVQELYLSFSSDGKSNQLMEVCRARTKKKTSRAERGSHTHPEPRIGSRDD
jgi:hypothetical protein